PAAVELRLVQPGPSGVDVGGSLALGGEIVVQLLAGDSLSRAELAVPPDVETRLLQSGDGPVQGRLGVGSRVLVVARVDQEQHVTATNVGPVAVQLRHHVAGDLRLDLGVDESVEGADPLMKDRHVLLHHRYHLHRENGRRGARGTYSTTDTLQ